MKRSVLAAVVASCVVFLSTLGPYGLPAALPHAVVASAPARVSHGNVSFVNALAGTQVRVVDVAKVPYQPNMMPAGMAPAHPEFRFSHYYSHVLPTGTIAVPTIAVYSTASFGEYKWDQVERRLLSILHAHPNLKKVTLLPLLPPQPAGQIFHAQEKYLSFKSGQALCYLTYYASDVSPVTANRLIYTCQGLTADAQYYVAAIFPVHISLLPGVIPGNFDYNAFAKSYERYIATLAARLDTPAAAQASTPGFAVLDSTVASIAISG